MKSAAETRTTETASRRSLPSAGAVDRNIRCSRSHPGPLALPRGSCVGCFRTPSLIAVVGIDASGCRDTAGFDADHGRWLSAARLEVRIDAFTGPMRIVPGVLRRTAVFHPQTNRVSLAESRKSHKYYSTCLHLTPLWQLLRAHN